MQKQSKYRLIALSGLAAVLSAGMAQAAEPLTLFKIADEWGTIRPAGVRPGTSGLRFWNAEGSANGANASTAPFRFYTADLISQFNTQFGAGQWHISTVNIVMNESNSAFTAAGGMKLYSFSNDNLAITNATTDTSSGPTDFTALPMSTLQYSPGANILNTTGLVDGAQSSDLSAVFGTVNLVDSYQFTSTGFEPSDFPLDVLANKNPDGSYRVIDGAASGIGIAGPDYGITLPIVNDRNPQRSDTLANFQDAATRVSSNLDIGPIASELAAGSDALSFILVADDATAATYKGNPNNGDYPVRIYITAEQNAATALAGDYNGDGHVDAADYTVWADHFGQAGTGVLGDGNGDGHVDAADYTVWADHFGQGSAVAGAVPEPSTALLALIGLPLISRRRR